VGFAPGQGSDISDPTVAEISYSQTSLAAVLSLNDLLEQVAAELPLITCPVLLVTSVNDHAVAAEPVRVSAKRISGPVTEVSLEHGFHMATMDVDHEELEQHAVDFVIRVADKTHAS
jgi:carboxylesterase